MADYLVSGSAEEKTDYFQYEVVRGTLLEEIVQFGGISLWHSYWGAFRNFILARISKTEFNAFMTKELNNRAVELHNSLVSLILSNINTSTTLQDNLSILENFCKPRIIKSSNTSFLETPNIQEMKFWGEMWMK